MQSFSSDAWHGAGNLQVSEPLRYVAQRFPELLDPHAHFGRSASFKLDPVTALREVIGLAAASTATSGRNPSTAVVSDALNNTRELIASEAHLANWFEPERKAAIEALAVCTDFAAAKQRRISARDWLAQELPKAARGPLLALRNALEAPDGYRQRLLAHIEQQTMSTLAMAPQWRAFDTDLQNLAALLLAEGRSGLRLGKGTARTIARAESSQAAIDRLRDLWTAEAELHCVAFQLPGVKRPKNLAAFGCRNQARTAGWGTGRRRRSADTRLREFSRSRDGVILTDVHASDIDQAHAKAFDIAERLADQYGAKHRTYRIEVDPEMLVLRVRDGNVTHVRVQKRTPPAPRALLASPNDALEQSFRYGALARSERSPIVRILHSWIALEALASEPTTPSYPYRFLQKHLAPALSLQAVRHGIAASWQIASRAGRRGPEAERWKEIERWLGIKSNGRTLDDLNAWTALLRGRASRDVPKSLPDDASARDAAAVFNHLLENFPPFPRKTVEYWQWMLKKGPRLANWCAVMELQAKTTLNRMYVVRNFSVHKALTKSDGAGQLSHAAHNVVDAVYEFLPAWLNSKRPIWKALDGIRRRSHHVVRTWSRHRRPALINAERLTRPGGDGLR